MNIARDKSLYESRNMDFGADSNSYVPSGVAFFALDGETQTRDFHFLLLPRFTMLAFTAAIEPLRIANQLTGRCLYRWHLVSEDGEPVNCSNGISLPVDSTLQPLTRNDVLLVCSGLEGFTAASQQSLGVIRKHV